MRYYLTLFSLLLSIGVIGQEFKVGLETRDKRSKRSIPAIISVRATNSEIELKGQMLDQQYVVRVLPDTEYQIVAAYQDYATYRQTLNFEKKTTSLTEVQSQIIELVAYNEPTSVVATTSTKSAETMPAPAVEKIVVAQTPAKQNIRFKVVDAVNNQPIAAKLKITDNVKETFSGSTSHLAEYEAELPIQNDSYQLTVSATGYRPYQESMNLKKALLPEQSRKTIKLSKADVMLIVNILDESTNKPLKADIRIIDSENGRASLNVKANPNGVTQIQPERKYLVEVESDGYLPISKSLSELLPSIQNSNSVVLKLAKYNQETYIALTAFNTLGKAIPATFKLTSQDSQQSYEVVTTTATPIGKFKLTEPDIYKIETAASGFKKHIGKLEAEEIMVGKDLNYEAMLVSDVPKVVQIPFNFQVTDALSGKNIAGFIPKVVNQKNKQNIVVKSSPAGFIADLQADNYYFVEVDANGYDKFSMKFEAASGGRSVFSVSMNPARKSTPPPVSTPLNTTTSKTIATPPTTAITKTTSAAPTTAKPNKKGGKAAKPVNDNIFDNIKAGQSLVIEDNVYFDQSSYILRYEAYPQLDRLVSVMERTSKLNVEIIGHTDNVGDPRLNMTLSENRAKVIANYLINHGIKEERISHTGKGQSVPLTTNDNEENKKRNRRVEFIIK